MIPGSYWCYHSAVSCPGRRHSSPFQLSRRPAGASLGMQTRVSPRWQQPVQSMESATEVRDGEWAAALPGCVTATRPAWLVSLPPPASCLPLLVMHTQAVACAVDRRIQRCKRLLHLNKPCCLSRTCGLTRQDCDSDLLLPY